MSEHPTKESGRVAEIRQRVEHYRVWSDNASHDYCLDVEWLLAERDALVLVAEAVVNGEWEAARELSDVALERRP